MTNSKRTIKILSSINEIKEGKKITLAIKGRGITIDALNISPTSIEMYFIRGEVKSVQATEKDKVKYEAMYNQILSGLMNKTINSNVAYPYSDFSRRYPISDLLMSGKHTESKPPMAEKDNEFARLQIQRERELEATSALNNEVSSTTIDTTTEPTTEVPSFISDKELEASTSTQSSNETSSTAAYTTTELKNEMQEIRKSNARYNISHNGEHLDPRQNTSEHFILGDNATTESTPMAKLDGAGGSSLATFAFSALGLAAVTVIITGIIRCVRKRSGPHDTEKAGKETGLAKKEAQSLLSQESQSRAWVKNPIYDSPRLQAKQSVTGGGSEHLSSSLTELRLQEREESITIHLHRGATF